MYQLTYQLPHSKDTKHLILKMDKEQQELHDIVMFPKNKFWVSH